MPVARIRVLWVLANMKWTRVKEGCSNPTIFLALLSSQLPIGVLLLLQGFQNLDPAEVCFVVSYLIDDMLPMQFNTTKSESSWKNDVSVQIIVCSTTSFDISHCILALIPASYIFWGSAVCRNCQEDQIRRVYRGWPRWPRCFWRSSWNLQNNFA